MTSSRSDGAVLPELDAFTANVLKHENHIYRFCLRMLNDKDDAFDSAQEVFVHALENADSFRGDAQLKTWLLTIAKNHCLNRLKIKRRRFRFWAPLFDDQNDEPVEVADLTQKTVEDAALHSEETFIIQEGLKTLDADSRALVILRDIEGLSYEEVAQISNVPLGTIKSRLHRAREKLLKACQARLSKEVL